MEKSENPYCPAAATLLFAKGGPKDSQASPQVLQHIQRQEKLVEKPGQAQQDRTLSERLVLKWVPST